jgi:hypothetical protein
MMTVYVHADYVHYLVTRRPITVILVIINDTPIRCIFKRQKTVETSTYGSKLVDSRIGMKLILKIRFMIQSLGVAFYGTALMVENNMSVVMNTTV